MNNSVEIFISYSYKDEVFREELGNHLKFLERYGLSVLWHDHMISPGSDREQEILQHLSTAQIILFLVSADFIASDYCNGVEVTYAMKRYEAGDAYVIPVIVREALWELAPFGKLSALPDYGKPITSDYWHSRDAAFRKVAEGILNVIKKLQEQQMASAWDHEMLDEAADATINSEDLYNSLIRLDFRDQSAVFQQFRHAQRHIGAFVIYGKPSCGQGWLLNRLLRTLPNSSTASVFKFSFERKACGISLRDLWQELAKMVGMRNLRYRTDEAQIRREVVEKFHRLWQTKSVFLLLSRVHEIDDRYIETFLQDFWYPLVDMTQNKPAGISRHYLLAFFIDNVGCVDRWHIPSTSSIDHTWEPYTPIKLKKLTIFPRAVLDNWLQYESETFPVPLTAQDILDHSHGGIPELAFDHVCGLFGYEWSEFVKHRL